MEDWRVNDQVSDSELKNFKKILRIPDHNNDFHHFDLYIHVFGCVSYLKANLS